MFNQRTKNRYLLYGKIVCCLLFFAGQLQSQVVEDSVGIVEEDTTVIGRKDFIINNNLPVVKSGVADYSMIFNTWIFWIAAGTFFATLVAGGLLGLIPAIITSSHTPKGLPENT